MGVNVYLYVDVDLGGPETKWFDVFSADLTHNLAKMASEAGIYKHIWRPDELPDVKCAGDLIEPLTAGVKAMKEDPERFIALNPPNGWGSYEGFLPWVERYLAACVEAPKALIKVSR